MTLLEKQILEQLQKLDETQQARVLAFINTLAKQTSLISEGWTDKEIAEMMSLYHHPQPQTGAEIVAFLKALGTTGWEHIPDGATWVVEQRHKQREFS